MTSVAREGAGRWYVIFLETRLDESGVLTLGHVGGSQSSGARAWSLVHGASIISGEHSPR